MNKDESINWVPDHEERTRSPRRLRYVTNPSTNEPGSPLHSGATDEEFEDIDFKVSHEQLKKLNIFIKTFPTIKKAAYDALENGAPDIFDEEQHQQLSGLSEHELFDFYVGLFEYVMDEVARED